MNDKSLENTLDVIVREARLEDLKAIHQLEQMCFDMPWSLESLYEDICENPNTCYLVVEQEGKILAYGGMWIIIDEAHKLPETARQMFGVTLNAQDFAELIRSLHVERYVLAAELLDEATASLDIENELAVKQAIANLLKEKKTVVMIAHTLSIVKNADQILVVEDGRIAESGTHDELVKQNGVYRRFTAIREQAEGWRIAAK